MGDPSKVILLEEMVKVIKDWRLLDNAVTVGQRMVDGLTRLQVHRSVLIIIIIIITVNLYSAFL